MRYAILELSTIQILKATRLTATANSVQGDLAKEISALQKEQSTLNPVVSLIMSICKDTLRQLLVFECADLNLYMAKNDQD